MDVPDVSRETIVVKIFLWYNKVETIIQTERGNKYE